MSVKYWQTFGTLKFPLMKYRYKYVYNPESSFTIRQLYALNFDKINFFHQTGVKMLYLFAFSENISAKILIFSLKTRMAKKRY